MMHSDEDDVRVAEGVELVSERVSGYRECTETVLRETTTSTRTTVDTLWRARWAWIVWSMA